MNRLLPSPDEVENARSPRGGWTRLQLARWGIGWPPPKGWKKTLQWLSLESEQGPNDGENHTPHGLCTLGIDR
jgi:hypothetical protein